MPVRTYYGRLRKRYIAEFNETRYVTRYYRRADGLPPTAPYVRDRTSAGSAGGSIVVNKPPATVDGDLLIALHFADPDGSTASMTAPGGWTQSGSTQSTANGDIKIWTKTAASEGASYTFGGDAASSNEVVILDVANVNATTPVDVAATFGAGGTSASHVAPTISPTVADDLLISGFYGLTLGTARTYTPPPPMSEEVDAQPSSSWIVVEVCSERLTVSGATGTRTATCSASVGWEALSLAVKAPAAGGTTFPVDQTDSAGLTDAAVLEQQYIETDSAGLVDSAALMVAPVLTDSAGLVDAAAVELIKTVAQTDAAGLTDAVLLAQSKGVTDSAGLVDAVVLDQARVLTDSAGLVDTQLIQSARFITPTDDAGLADSAAFSRTQVFTDSAGLMDATAFSQAKVLTDSAGLTDATSTGLQRDMAATDSAGLADTRLILRSLELSDIAGLVDSVAWSQALVLADVAGLTDVAAAASVSASIPGRIRVGIGAAAGVSSGSGTAAKVNPGTGSAPRVR
jgi:hypothetical protein